MIMKRNLFTWLFALVLGILYGIIAAGQILGVARLYYSWLVLPLGLLLSILVVIYYIRSGKDFFAVLGIPSELDRYHWLNAAFLISGVGVFLLLIFYPLVHWPYSPISAELPWDAGLYHFPKAIEMIVTHSSLDLSISYGEYPFGYETLVAFGFLLNHAGFLLGAVHALISLFLLLSILLLTIRQ